MRHCNGCGKEKTDFIGKDTRCRECRGAQRAARTAAVLADEALRGVFTAAVEAVRGEVPADRIVRPGIPTYPGVRDARRELYRKLRRAGWPLSTIAAFSGQTEVTVARALA